MTDTNRNIEITTGSRLHFGLTMVGQRRPGEIGGMGVMIESPRTRISVRAAEQFSVVGCQRAIGFAERWRRCCPRFGKLTCHIEVHETPVAHAGLGSGTQMAMAIATGLNRFANEMHPDRTNGEFRPPHVASLMERGQRSMIGTLGFFSGGLIVDQVPLANDASSHLAERIEIPESWRVVLVRQRGRAGQFGEHENATFRQLNSASNRHSARMNDLILSGVLPATADHDFDKFSRAISEFGALSGEYYRSFQGGIYNGADLAKIVDSFREAGVAGVGQSSWGPTVFGWCQDQEQADRICQYLKVRWGGQADVSVTSARNRGYSLVKHDDILFTHS